MSNYLLNGKLAVVTGANRGIGRSITETFAENRCDIFACMREVTLETKKWLKSLENKFNIVITPIELDLSDEDSIKNSIKQIFSISKRIDILVNNAGILRDKSFHKVTLDDFDLVMDVHFQGSLNCTHTIYPIMREQEYGRIIFTSSASGVFGNFGQTNYGSAKMAMIGLMNTLKIEGQNKNVFTISITPVA